MPPKPKGKSFKDLEIERQNKLIQDKLLNIKTKKGEIGKIKDQQPRQIVANSFTQRQKMIQNINNENERMAQRIIESKPDISKNDLEEEFQKNKKYGEKILRYHLLAPKEEKEYEYKKQGYFDEDQSDDENDQKENVKAYMYIKLQNILLTSSKHKPDPTNKNELWFLEIKACYKAMRQTIPETWEDCSKSIINEFFNLKQLRKSKNLFIAIYKIKDKDEQPIYVGDFELDLSPYLETSDTYQLQRQLIDSKSLSKNYLGIDQCTTGYIDFSLKLVINRVKNNQLEDNVKATNTGEGNVISYNKLDENGFTAQQYNQQPTDEDEDDN